MSLALSDGEEITVVTDGEDEQKAAEGIRGFFERVQNNLKRQKRRAVQGRSAVLFCSFRREVYSYEKNAVHL